VKSVTRLGFGEIIETWETRFLSQYGYKPHNTNFVHVVHALQYVISSSVDPNSLVVLPLSTRYDYPIVNDHRPVKDFGWTTLNWMEVGSPNALSPLPFSRLDYYLIGAPGISIFSLFCTSTE